MNNERVVRQVSTTSFSELEEQKTWPTSTRRWIMNVCVVSCMRKPNQTEPAPWAKCAICIFSLLPTAREPPSHSARAREAFGSNGSGLYNQSQLFI